jgi:hypothetical protein
MHPIPEMLNPPGEPIYCVVASSLIKIVASITAPATCGHSASPDNVLVGIS